MGNRAIVCLSGSGRVRAGTGRSGLALLGPLFGVTTIKKPRNCATQQGSRHPRWKPHGFASLIRLSIKRDGKQRAGPGAPVPSPHSPALLKPIRRERKSVQPVFPLPSPRFQMHAATTPVSLSFSLPPSPPFFSLSLSLVLSLEQKYCHRHTVS